MKRLENIFTTIFVWVFHLSCFSTETTTWEGSIENRFFATIQISSTHISLNEPLTVNVILKYPSTYLPNLKSMRKNLLSYAGLNPPPFALEKETVHTEHHAENSTTQIEWILSPQTPGKHFLYLQTILFENTDKTKPPVTLISDVFKINVSLNPFQFQSNSYIAPLLSLTQTPPITMSAENKQLFQKNPALSAQEIPRNLRLLKSKTLPWEMIFASIVVLIAYLLIKASPPQQLPKKEILEASYDQVLKEFEDLTQTAPTSETYIRYFTQLDHVIRTRFVQVYGNDALTSTSQELLKKAEDSTFFNDKIRLKLALFLKSVDQIKYAHHQPSAQECQKTIEIAKQLIFVPLSMHTSYHP